MQLANQSAVPPTVGKYQQRRRVVPILNLPSPGPPRSPSPPPPMHLFLKEQYFKKRRQQSPGFTDTDLARVSRFLFVKSRHNNDSFILRKSKLPNTISNTSH